MSLSPPDGPQPAEQSAISLSEEWLQQTIRDRIHALGVSAARLSEVSGQSQSTWRSKMNGTRAFQLADLLLMAVAIDSQFFARPPFTSPDLLGYFPPEVGPRLSHTDLGRAVPSIGSETPDWESAGTQLTNWVRTELDEGRGWLLHPAALARQVLLAAQRAGLSATSASLTDRTDTRVEFEWIGHDVLFHVVMPPDASTVGSERVHHELRSLAATLRTVRAQPQQQKALVHLLSPTTAAAFRQIAEVDRDPASRANNLSIGALHRLDREHAWGDGADIHVDVLVLDEVTGMLWVWVK